MSLYRVLRSKLYQNSEFLQYLWLRHEWRKRRKEGIRLNDEEYAIQSYQEQTGKELNLKNPQTFDEKLWYLKLHNRDPLLTICSDKYCVREYVQQCGLGHILNELYGAYSGARDIDFDTLPSPCFLKCNHTSGINIIFDRTKPFNKKGFVRKFNFMLKQNYFYGSREWNYKNIDPKIIAEKVLRDKSGNLPLDYKFLCFGGEPKLMYLSVNTCTEQGEHNTNERYLNTYDMDFNLTNIDEGFPILDDGSIKKPNTFEIMKKYAGILSKPFEHCRVDFYDIDGKIYFGEITFYDGGGCNYIQPHEWDLKIGSWIDINRIK